MVKIIYSIVALSIVVFPSLVHSELTAGVKQSVVVRTEDFKGFEKCEGNDKLQSIIDSIFENPTRKEDSVWVYEIKGEYFGLPVTAIAVGVCDDTGERACGWASYLALMISGQLEEVRALLMKKTGVDFTVEKRDPDVERTLQPILKQRRDKKNESVLYCDPGNL